MEAVRRESLLVPLVALLLEVPGHILVAFVAGVLFYHLLTGALPDHIQALVLWHSGIGYDWKGVLRTATGYRFFKLSNPVLITST